ncbi:MAG: ATP-binding cassette domain-containing protein [Hellea sp.]
MIHVEKLNKSFNGKKIISNISLSIQPGKITSIIGPSGGGKTTFLKCLSMLAPPDTGTIKVDDQVYVFPNDTRIRNAPPWPKLNVVFQQLFLWPHLTLRQNIFLPLQLQSKAMKDYEIERRKSRAEKLIEELSLQDAIDRFPNETSLGQRQRAAIIRALALEPSYLLLDEVTSALDIEHIGIVLNTLKEASSDGMGILLVTHLLKFAMNSSDHIVFLEDGIIYEQGKPDIIRNPHSERLREFLSLIKVVS